MVKQVILEQKYDCEHLLGKFIDHDSYDFIATEDIDVYKPLGVGEEPNESNILLKFRKGVFSKSITDPAYIGLKEGAILSDNRGLAAGTQRDEYQITPDGHGKRRWVTERERAIIDYFLNDSKSTFGDRVEEILNTVPNTPLTGRGASNKSAIKGGAVWIVEKSKEFNFDSWIDEVKHLSLKDRKERTIEMLDMVSDTTYGNSVRSGTAGFFDRYPRIPFCRETSWSAGNHDLFKKGYPLFEAASKEFRKNLPIRWNGQHNYAKQLKDPNWLVGNSVYTTITINRDFRTACHRDDGDLCETERVNNPAGFSNLTVLSDGKNFDGMYLCFPEYRVCADIKPGDLIMMDAHQIHGNVPLISCDEGFERVSVVMYFRTAMTGCGTKVYEQLRRDFVNHRRLNTSHTLWHQGWNGVSPGMFDTDEWIDYLAINGALDLHTEMNKEKQVTTLDNWF